MNATENLVTKIREHEAALETLLGLLNELTALASPKLITDDLLAPLKKAAAGVRAAKQKIIDQRRAVEAAEHELDALVEKAGVPESRINKAQVKLDESRRALDLCERQLKAALRQQAEAADEARAAIEDKHEAQRHVGHELMRQFKFRSPEGTFRYALDQLVLAADNVHLRALNYDLRTEADDDFRRATKNLIEPPLPERQAAAQLASV